MYKQRQKLCGSYNSEGGTKTVEALQAENWPDSMQMNASEQTTDTAVCIVTTWEKIKEIMCQFRSDLFFYFWDS